MNTITDYSEITVTLDKLKKQLDRSLLHKDKENAQILINHMQFHLDILRDFVAGAL